MEQEKVRMWQADTGLGSINLMHARYVAHTFAPHFHDVYCIGVIERGALGFRYRGENVTAPQGSTIKRGKTDDGCRMKFENGGKRRFLPNPL